MFNIWYVSLMLKIQTKAENSEFCVEKQNFSTINLVHTSRPYAPVKDFGQFNHVELTY